MTLSTEYFERQLNSLPDEFTIFEYAQRKGKGSRQLVKKIVLMEANNQIEKVGFVKNKYGAKINKYRFVNGFKEI
jgi:hypothetical protein